MLGAVIVLTAAALVAAWILPSNHYLYLPDPARAVDPLVAVPNERPDAGSGGIYMVDVSIRRASVLERYFPGIDSGATLVPAKVFLPPGVSESEHRVESLKEMSTSKQVATAVALRSLGYAIDPKGAEVVSLTSGYPAAKTLRDGDVIVRLEGTKIRSPDDLTKSMSGRRPGVDVRLVVRRNGRATRLTVGTRADPGEKDRAVMGVLVQPQLEFPIPVKIDAGDIGGPSAGLAFALDIVDELGRDVTRGRRIAATGQLELDGTVLPVGGLKQKTIGARETGMDVLLVPAGENAAVARRYAEGLTVLPVRTFGQALRRLATLGRGR